MCNVQVSGVKCGSVCRIANKISAILGDEQSPATYFVSYHSPPLVSVGCVHGQKGRFKTLNTENRSVDFLQCIMENLVCSVFELA